MYINVRMYTCVDSPRNSVIKLFLLTTRRHTGQRASCVSAPWEAQRVKCDEADSCCPHKVSEITRDHDRSAGCRLARAV